MIPIRDGAGRSVGKVNVGEGYRGDQFDFVADGRLSREEKETIKDRFDSAVLRGSYYADVQFVGPANTMSKGWSNFFGIAEALARCLPGNGLFVEWNEIVWPGDTPRSGYADHIEPEPDEES